MTWLLAVTWLLAAALAAEPSPGCEPLADDDAVHERTLEIASGLRCPVCQGMSVADSSTEVAVGMKNQIERMVREGWCEPQIVDYFIERYSTWVLLEPPPEGNQAIYIVPGVIFAFGLGVVIAQKRRRQAPVAVRSEERDEWRQKVLDELER